MTDKQYEYISMKISLRLATYRKLAGMSQEELAEKSGISLSTIGKLEATNICTSPGAKTLFALAEVLGISAAQFLDIDDPGEVLYSYIKRSEML